MAARAKTPSYIIQIKLNTNKYQAAMFDKVFFYGQRIYNVLVKHCKKQLKKLYNDKEYQDLLKKYVEQKSSVSKSEKCRLATELSDIRKLYGLSESQLHAFVKIQQHKYKKYIGSAVAQKIASEVWRSVEKYIFGNGKSVHFKKYIDFDTLEGKNNSANIRFKDGHIIYNDMHIYMSIDKDDDYHKRLKKDKVKYCRIKRMIIGTKYHYYVQLVMNGYPPMKNHKIKTGTVGIDLGTSTLAYVSKDTAELKVLGNNVKRYDKEIKRLDKAMDRSRRAMNPSNYNKDGTVKSGRKVWTYSNRYKKLQRKRTDLYRRQAASLKQSHEIDANQILEHGNLIYVERMRMSALAKRSKETKKSKSGKYQSKKRFGKSIGGHAPAMLINILNRKLSRFGLTVMEVNTNTFKASQYNHITDTYEKKKLSKRYNLIDEKWIQRDLYSAFLIMNADDTLEHADRNKCIDTYDQFVINHDQCIEKLKKSNRKLPNSFGIRKAE